MDKRSRRQARQDVGEDEQLRGSFVSVLIIGALIAASWLVVLGIYFARQ